jgi:hypothetical protein
MAELSEVSYSEARLFADVMRMFTPVYTRAGGVGRCLSISSARPFRRRCPLSFFRIVREEGKEVSLVI